MACGSIILFRFHDHPKICTQRINHLKNLNPDIEIYGLGENIDSLNKLFDAGLEHNYVISNKSSRWKWKNGDLALRKWYNNIGREIEFDRLYLVEWDMVYTAPMEEVYRNIPRNGIGIPGLEPVQSTDRTWVNGRYEEINYLRQTATSRFSQTIDELKVGLFPGVVVPNGFLEAYCSAEIPEVGNDEIRFSVFGQASEYDVYDPMIADDEQIFNTVNNTITPEQIHEEEHRNVFHPVRLLM